MTLVGAVLIGCGSSESANSGRDGPADVVSSTATKQPTTASMTTAVGSAAHLDVRFRLLVDGAPFGGVWTTRLITSDSEMEQLVAELHVAPPSPAVMFDDSVVIYFAPRSRAVARTPT
jgi:hypothetical protein